MRTGLVVFALLAVTAAFAAGPAPAPERTRIVVGINEDYPPFEFVSPSGAAAGYDVDLVRAICDVMGLEPVFRPGPWAEIRSALENGEIDAIAGMLYSTDRARRVDFCVPHTIVHYSIFVRRGERKVRSATDLARAAVLVERGSVMHDYLEEHGLIANARPTTSEPEALRLLAAGQADCALAPTTAGAAMARQFGLTNVVPLEPPVYSRDLCIAVRRGRTDLRASLDEGLSVLIATGRQRELQERWFGPPETGGVPLRTILKYGVVVLVPVLLLLAASVLWSWSLRKEVARRTAELNSELAERRRSEDALRYRLEIERVTTRISSRFVAVSSHALMGLLSETLREIGEFAGVERAYVIFCEGDGVPFQYGPEWCADGVVSGIEHYQGKTPLDLAWAFGEVRRRGVLHVPQVAALPEEAAVERAFWLGLGNRSLLWLPLMRGQRLYGIIGFVTFTKERRWPDEDIEQLRIVAQLLTGALERRESEATLVRAQQMESIGVLAGGIAHDFNNILTAVLGGISLARDLAVGDPQLASLLSDTESATLHARGLTQQLLTFARGGAPVRKPASLCEIVPASVSFALRGSSVSCRIDVPDDLPPVNADPGQLGQVIQNLVINARQAMPDGGTVTLSAAAVDLGETAPGGLPPGRYVRLRVTDEGVGIPPENMPRIFDPYFSTKAGGSGLGLASVFSIVAHHQGYITARSRVGRGTTFTIYLPVAALPEHVAQPERPVLRRGQGRVLFMDDDPLVQSMALQMITHLGYEVDHAADGARAVELYREALAAGRRYDVVVADLTVPGGMGGKECIARLRELDPGVRAVVSSGYSNDPVMAEHGDHGFRAVVSKPYRIEELSEVLAELTANTAGRDLG